MIILAILIAVVFLGCSGNNGSPKGEVSFSNEASYAMGLSVGADIKGFMDYYSASPNMDELTKGLKDGLTGKFPRFELEQANEIINAAVQTAQEQQKAIAQDKENKFLAENAKKPGINVTPSGLQYEIILDEDGPKPAETDTVSVNYEGTLTDGTVFDKSEEGSPAVFGLNQVIPGWTEGLQLMSVGSKYKFYIPSVIGYGEGGQRNPYTGEVIIPPFAALIFEVELLEIKSGD